MIHNSHRNDKLSGYHVLHMQVDGQVKCASIDNWIAHEPVLLYQAVMGKNKCCVIYPTMLVYTPSLQLPVLKKLEQEVKKIRSELVLGKSVRKVKRLAR